MCQIEKYIYDFQFDHVTYVYVLPKNMYRWFIELKCIVDQIIALSYTDFYFLNEYSFFYSSKFYSLSDNYKVIKWKHFISKSYLNFLIIKSR